jgi:hypothetical protein
MAKKFDNISNNNVHVSGNGLSGLFSSKATLKEETPSVQAAQMSTPISPTTRQTFVILAEDLQYIKDIVRAKRMEGEIEFTQKEALHYIIEFHRKNQ